MTAARNSMARIAATVVALAVVTGFAWGAFDSKGWSWRRPITVPANASQFVRMPLPLPVLDTCQPSLADLRVLDQRDNLVPYIVWRAGGREPAAMLWKDATLLNPVFQPGQYSRVTVDFGEAAPKNRVRVVTSGTNYRRRVTIEGSSDGTSWDILLENGWLFDVPSPDQACRLDTVSFPTITFRHLRITVFNMQDDPRRIDITAVQTAHWIQPAETPLLPVAVKSSSPQFDEKTRQSTYDLDLGYKNVPVASVEVTVSDPFYHRGYELEGRNVEKIVTRRRTESAWETEERDAPWERISNGVLYRIQHDNNIAESRNIPELHTAYRYLRLRVFEQDNPPLVIPSIAVRRWDTGIVFECKPGETYSLAGGNASASAPSFDLGMTQSGLEKRTLPIATVEEATTLETVTPESKPWSERYAVLLWAALLLAAGVVVTLILKNLNKLKPDL